MGEEAIRQRDESDKMQSVFLLGHGTTVRSKVSVSENYNEEFGVGVCVARDLPYARYSSIVLQGRLCGSPRIKTCNSFLRSLTWRQHMIVFHGFHLIGTVRIRN